MDEFDPLWRSSFWNRGRIDHTIVGTILTGLVALLAGLAYGASLIFQPYPQPTIGPIPDYLLGAGVLALAAGWWVGRRHYMIEAKYGDPGHAMIIFFAALSIASVAMWSASGFAAVHVPDASTRYTGTTPTPTSIAPGSAYAKSQGASPQLHIIPGSKPGTCGDGIAAACSALMSEYYSRAAGYVQDVTTLCSGIIADNGDPALINKCNELEHGWAGMPGSDITSQLSEIQRDLPEVGQVLGLPPVRVK